MRRWFWSDTFSIDVPASWEAVEMEGLVEILPEAGVGAAHVSVHAREEPSHPVAGEAVWFVEAFANGQGTADEETWIAGALLATASYVTSDESGDSRWDVGCLVGSRVAVPFSYNDQGASSELRKQALDMFRTIQRR